MAVMAVMALIAHLGILQLGLAGMDDPMVEGLAQGEMSA